MTLEIVYEDSLCKSPTNTEHKLLNKHLENLDVDVLYHLALDTKTHNFQEMFGDIKFVCVGGTPNRMKSFAYIVGQELGIKLPTGSDLIDISQASHRYSMFKMGPVLSVSHGMGTPSLSILLHELIKLISYAKCKDVIFLRIGTSGGIGVEPGTVVISDGAVDTLLRPYYELHILGKVVHRPAVFDHELVNEIKSIAQQSSSDFQVVTGKTMCANDFYESQGRLDGAFCGFDEFQKMNYLQRVAAAGVVNIEMEATTFASMCHHAGIKGAIICVTLINRLNGDQLTQSKDTMAELQKRPQILAAKFIKKRLSMVKK